MKKIYKQILFLLPFVVLFSSCVDITRNIVINKNGTGKETMTVNLSSQFFRMMQALASLDTTKKTNPYDDTEIISQINSSFKNSEYISGMNVNSALNADSSKTLTVNYNFSKISVLALDMNNLSGNGDSLIYLREENGNMKFYYKLVNENGDDQNSDSTNNSMDELSAKMFEGKTFTVNIEFPYDVISTNASSQNGRKLTWVFPMDVIKKAGDTRVMEAVLRK
ncbi:MAG: hypothetical protein JSS63_11790 [Bacteroidetes bacterium]|nr:hypothetical protein [Bacteroidota bacterium]MBX7045155.1 hypothetical protein [Ignavibacteria bacterium]